MMLYESWRSKHTLTLCSVVRLTQKSFVIVTATVVVSLNELDEAINSFKMSSIIMRKPIRVTSLYHAVTGRVQR